MPVRTTTYNKSSILQRDLPNANFICTDGDGLKFTPSAGDSKVSGLAQNTYHPPESKSVLWNSVKLNWTRQALSNYNLLTQNQSNACEDGTTTGFWSQSSATLTASTTEHYEGSYSLKVVTPGVASGEGMATSNVKATPGYKYSAKARVKGSGTVVLQLVERDSAGTSIAWTYSSVITLTSSWQEINVSQMFTMGVNVNLKVLTSGAQAVTFYVDTLQINAGDPTPWVEGPASDFKVTASLLGLTNNGEESLIGEKIITTCPITETNEVLSFDLLSSACQTPFTRESGTAPSGKIQLNLPKRYSNYESITLNRVWLDGWSKRKTAIITGSTDYTYYDFVIGPLTIPYVSGMNTDFSDLRFAIWNGTGYTLCSYGIFSKTNGSTAKVFVKIPTLTQSPATVNLYMFFGNDGATSLSNLGIIYMYDDFEDGKYNGRTSPYVNYTVNKGSAAIISSGQISENYSLKHTGGNDTYTAPMTFAEANRTCIIDFDFKLTVQGSGTYDPYITLFYLQYVDANNFLRVDTYWNGTNQIVRLLKNVGGTLTTVSSWNWLTTKLPAGSQNHYKIISYLPSTGTQYVTVIIDSTKIFNAVNPNTSLSNTMKGFGCLQSAQGIWDNIKIRPYVGSFVFNNGNEPSIGSWGAESLPSVTPDSANPDDTKINFTAPYDWSDNSYAYLNFKEYNSFNITTRIIPLSVQNIAFLGYNGLDAFNALRLKIESECNDDYTFKFNNFKFRYII